MFYDDERTNFIEEQVERRKRDTKLARGRKGTLKIPLGQVVSVLSDSTAVTSYDVIFYHFTAEMLRMEIPEGSGCLDGR